MQGFIYCHRISFCGQVSRACKSCRSGSDYSDTFAVSFSHTGCFVISVYSFQLYGMLCMPISHKSFQTADGYRLTFDAAYASSFTLVLLRTYSSADARKGAVFRYDLICSLKIAFSDLCDEVRYPDHYRAALGAGFRSALQAAHCFIYSHFRCVALSYFFKVSSPYLRLLFWHRVLYRFKINHCNAHLLSDGRHELCHEPPGLHSMYFF